MLHLRITFQGESDLRRVLTEEMRRGVMLAKIEAPPTLEFRERVLVEVGCAGRTVRLESEVLSILPGVGVGVAFPPERLPEVQSLLGAAASETAGPTVHEILGAPAAASVPPEGHRAEPGSAAFQRLSFAEKVQVALHGSRDDRAAILRDQNKQLHPFVLRSPGVTPEEIAGFAANAQMSPDFLKQIAERKEWLSRPAIALALARNPKTPAEIAVKAVDYVPVEALRQMAKGVGALPHVVQAARKKILPK